MLSVQGHFCQAQKMLFFVQTLLDTQDWYKKCLKVFFFFFSEFCGEQNKSGGNDGQLVHLFQSMMEVILKEE